MSVYGFPVALVVNVGGIRDTVSISGSGRSPGGGHGNPLQYSCWRIPRMEEFGGLLSMGSQSQTRLKRLSVHAHNVSIRTGTQQSLLVGWMDEWEEGRLEGGGEGWMKSGWVDGQRGERWTGG